MKFGRLGLRGKFVVALLVAAALPFVVGLVVFESNGYQHLLRERGQLHQVEALTLVRALEQAARCQADTLHTWLEADPSLIEFVSRRNQEDAGTAREAILDQTRRLDEIWASLPPGDPKLRGILDNPASDSMRRFAVLHPEVAEAMATDRFGRLVAATRKTSDFGQADEEWWVKGTALAPGFHWMDALKFDESSDVFSLDTVLPLWRDNELQGVAKMSIDVTSLFARLGFDGESVGERWEIALPDGRILASSRSGFDSLEERLSESALDQIREHRSGWAQAPDSQGEARMMGYVAMGSSQMTPNAYVIFSSLREDVVAPLQRSFLWMGVAGTALLAVCTWIGFQLIRKNILRPLSALGAAARSISATARLRQPFHQDEGKLREQREQAEADLLTIENIRTGDEIESLSSDLAVMTSRVLRYHRELESEVAAKTSVIREDLEMAREFQNALLPSRYPEVPSPATANPLRLQFSHFYQPASTVGGDFFDLIELDENRAGILIADVMGHGARSALVTAILRALVRHRTRTTGEPGAFLSELNSHLLEVISRCGQTLFVTAFFLILDTRQGKALWAVAGHPAPLRVRRGSGKPPEPMWDEPQHQPALGLMANTIFQTYESPLRAGDIFLLFTDGAVEAENPEGDNFGLARLARSFDQALDGPMAAMPAKIVCDVTSFQRRRTYDDDVCLVAVEALSAAKKPAETPQSQPMEQPLEPVAS